jgi:hypothetical protein
VFWPLQSSSEFSGVLKDSKFPLNPKWGYDTYINRFQAGDWISKIISKKNIALTWIYHVTGVTPNTVQVVEFQRVTPTSLIKATNSKVITLSLKGYHPIRVFSQERHGTPFRVAKELPSLTKAPLTLDFRIRFHWWASMGPKGMALVTFLPNGWFSIFWLFCKARLLKLKETHLERKHLLLHSKVKPAKLHRHANYG